MTYGERAKLVQDIRDGALAYARAEERMRAVFEGPFKDDVLSLKGEFWLTTPDSRRYRQMADAADKIPVS